MKLPIFHMKAGFVQDVEPDSIPVRDEPAFVYDTSDAEKVRVLMTRGQGYRFAEAIASMARLMGLPCLIRVRDIHSPVSLEEVYDDVTVLLPFRLNKEAVNRYMEVQKIGTATIAVGFTQLKELTEAMKKERT